MELGKDGCLAEQIGDFLIKSPKMPARSEFLNGDVKNKKDQKFTYTKIPTDEELKIWTQDKRKAFIEQEWRRRHEGVWFYNNGKPTWITGVHYYYLNYYHLDIGKPDYLDVDRRFFWMWWMVENDDKCEGLFFVARRQSGKSYRAGCIILEHATRSFNVHNGIQSKTDDDAKALFKEKVVHAWKKLPSYFFPKFNNSNNPETAIRFEAPTKTGKGTRGSSGGLNSELDLNSFIDRKNSKENAYDGQKLARFINDEILKKQEYDPFKRWSIVRRMFVQRGIVIGKSLHTSTVGEEIDDTQVAAGKELWNNCDPTKRYNGKTKSGLYRLFFPSYDGSHPDEYGMSDIQAGRAEYDGLREAAGNDAKELRSVQRAFPYSIEEAMMVEGKKSIYDIATLASTLSDIQSYTFNMGKEPFKRYRLEWVDRHTKSMVRAVPDEKGRFKFSWMPGDNSELNLVQASGQVQTLYGTKTRWLPLNDHRFGIGTDPFDKKRVNSQRHASQAAAHGFRKLDVFNELNPDAPGYWPSNATIFEYIERPERNDIFYEDMVMACHFLGCSLLFESNKCKIEDYFVNCGYEAFLATRPEFTHTDYTEGQVSPGLPSSPLVKGKYIECTEDFISGTNLDDPYCLARDWRRCPFPDTINQLIEFDPEKTTKFDGAVALGFTLMQVQRFSKPRPSVISMEGLVNYR